MSGKSGKKEAVSKQSAAQFFSEHQQIAGFDNPGKSLFTTIREFVENSLDAAESMHVLPEIELRIEEFSEAEHNSVHGIRTSHPAPISSGGYEQDEDYDMEGESKPEKTKPAKASKDSAKEGKEQMYYLICCSDNGCGIPEENIGDMLGRVLTGSKHGIRQTRGKFGLGAKMALIWSKKSSGLPIQIRTAHSSNPSCPPGSITTVTLDIDIFRNEPRILKKQVSANPDGWRGTEITVTIAGHWGNYRSRVLQYFQQLAVITPYAKLAVDFTCHRDVKKSFRADFDRRSEQMPPIAQEIDPHPKSLNNITLSNLLQAQSSTITVEKFLTSALSGITSSVATRITSSLGISQKAAKSLQAAHVAALIQALRDERQIKPPAAVCLSPAGEYNMRLGVLKELKPKMVATFSDKPGAHEGHPFLVEAAISLGGTQVREGINVYRFANRIPLLFEAGADVVTQVATKRINWSSYHIDPKKDNIGVYVSIVSTKIPFKGTSKEYVGEDVTELFQSVKRALQGCCQQLRVNLAKSLAMKEEAERRKTLVKYIPNISKALFAVVQKMENKSAASSKGSSGSRNTNSNSGASTEVMKVLLEVSRKTLTESTLSDCLQKAVEKFESESLMQSALDKAAGDAAGAAGKRRRLFISPDSLLIRNPLPAELLGDAGADRDDVALVRQGSTQSIGSVSFSGDVVDLTSETSTTLKESTNSVASPITSQRHSVKRSYLGTFQSTHHSPWIELSLPNIANSAASTAASGENTESEGVQFTQVFILV